MSNSVNTNIGALLGQKYLRSNSSDMVTVQNRVSSGLRVATVMDDASTFAVAASMRGNIKGYTAIAGALQGAKVGGAVAVAAGETISKRLEEIKAKVIQLADESISSASRTTYQNDLTSMVTEVNNYLRQASYNGVNLLGSGGADVLVVANVDASAITIRNQDVADLSGASLTIADAAGASNALSLVATRSSPASTPRSPISAPT
jgi:flagellin